jgi:GGDEF domain-containing protein
LEDSSNLIEMFENDKYSKIYNVFSDLAKSDSNQELKTALATIRKHSPESGKVIAKHIYIDTLTGNVGNRFAWINFLKKHSRDGIHLAGDLNSFRHLNNTQGHDVGDQAIKTFFNISTKISRKFGGKQFRPHGDESKLWFPTPERAQGYIEELKKALNEQEKIGGQHKISVAMGQGYTPEHAEKALMSAKDLLGPLVGDKRQRFNPPGQEETVFFSLLHEHPPMDWRPAVDFEPRQKSETIDTNGLKLANPLKSS